MMERKKRLFGGEIKLPATASAAYIISGVLGKGVGFFATVIFTRLLTPDEYGLFTVYLGWLGIASIICSAFISGNVIYKGLSERKEERVCFLSAVYLSYAVFSSVISIMIFAVATFFGFPVRLIPIATLQVLFDGLGAVKLSERKYFYSYRSVALAGIGEALLSLAISFILIYYFDFGYYGRVIGYLLASVAVGGGALSGFRHIGKLKENLKYLLLRVMPLIPSALMLAVSRESDKLLFERLLGADAAAKYSVTHSVGAGGLFLVTSLGSALHPWLTRRLERRELSAIRSVTDPLLSLFSVFTVFLVALAPLGIRILAPTEYFEALPALLPIALSVIPSLAGSILTAQLIHRGRGRAVSAVAMLSGGVGILANFLLIPLLAYLGAGLSVLISSLVSYLGLEYSRRNVRADETVEKKAVVSRLIYSAILSTLTYLSYPLPYLIPLILILPALELVRDAMKVKEIVLEA